MKQSDWMRIQTVLEVRRIAAAQKYLAQSQAIERTRDKISALRALALNPPCPTVSSSAHISAVQHKRAERAQLKKFETSRIALQTASRRARGVELLLEHIALTQQTKTSARRRWGR